jgi:uncharacterized protein (DUF1501 family)
MKSNGIPGCEQFQRGRMNRRSLLQLSALGFGSSLLGNQFATAGTKQANASAKSVIMLFQFGGPSQLETFDPKPDAPSEIRGEFKAVPTKTSGLLVSEHLPKLSQLSKLYSVARTVSHRKSAHNSGAYYSLTGREPLIDIVTANASASDFPHPGSIVDHLDRSSTHVPKFVSLPTMIADGPFRTPGEFGGFLGKVHDPLWVLGNPNDSKFKVDELTLPTGLDVQRLMDRQSMQQQLKSLSDFADRSQMARGMSDLQAKAVGVLTSPEVKNAFDMTKESAATRERYGRNTYGQSVLLARRMVEAGVKFITVYYSAGIGGWDTHKQNFSTLKDSRLPQTDLAVSALLTDLHDRGLLDSTLVYWTGDFGRTPKINSDAGRDHWPQCQSVMLAGGGIQGGRTYGVSDSKAAYPKDDPLRPDDITATVFHAMGLDHTTEIHDQLQRPFPISRGEPIRPLFA